MLDNFKKYRNLMANVLAVKVLSLSLILCFFVSTPALVLAAAIPPALVEQAKRMSPKQRQALAAQYGINLGPQAGGRAGLIIEEQVPAEALQRPLEEELFLRDLTEIEGLERGDPDELKRFGSRMFDVDESMYEPQEGTSVPQNYLFGPGDRLLISLLGKVNAQYDVLIESDGSMIVPDVGPISVAGLTFAELKRVTDRVVKDRLIGVDAFVTPTQLRRISVAVLGEVEKPGQYLLSSLANVLHALYMAGGPTDIGSYRNIKIVKADSKQEDFDLYSVLLSGQGLSKTLDDGDVILVAPLSNEVSISGEVRRPARYEIKENTTIGELIAMAGGITSNAFEKGLILQRFDTSIGAPSILQVDSFGTQVVLRDGDQVTIRAGSDQPVNPVKISGAVSQPGVYQYIPGARVGDYLSSLQADYLLESDLQMGLIVRRINAELDIEVRAFSPVEAASGALSEGNPTLQVFDEIIILPLAGVTDEELSFKFSVKEEEEEEEELEKGSESEKGSEEEALSYPTRDELVTPLVAKLKRQASPGKPARTVTLYGAVNDPGEYPLVVSRDAIDVLLSLAGGVRDGAFLGSVELRRREISGEQIINSVQSVNLDAGNEYIPEPADELRLNFFPGWRDRETAILAGEVQFPGEYTLTPGDTILSLIERAGGFTDQAFVEALRFRSATAKEQQQLAVDKALVQTRKSAALIQTDPSLSGSQPPDLTEDVFAFEVEGRIVVDMPRILAGDLSADIAVQDGDEILVPRVSEVVYVVGDVLEPGNYRHIVGTSVEEYINLAAGYTATAKKKDVYFILPNGSVQRLNQRRRLLDFGRNSSDIVAGTTIVVPPNLDYAKPLDFYTQVSSVVFQSMASIAAFFNLAKN